MWNKIADYILKHRVLNICIGGVILVVLIFEASKVKMSYEFARTLPDTDSTMVIYQRFLDEYGQDGCMVFVGVNDPDIFELERFQSWYHFNEALNKVEGVTGCLSVSKMYNLEKIDSLKTFSLTDVVPCCPVTQEEIDSIRSVIDNLVVYEGLLFNTEDDVYMVIINIDKELVNTKKRDKVINDIEQIVTQYGSDNGLEMHVSGMPYIRTMTTNKMKVEIVGFILLSIVVATTILLLFFRSFKTIVSILVIVGLSVIFMFGTLGLLGYKVTILTGVLPPLLIIISVENSIFLLNKYHREYLRHKDKMIALNIVIQRIGAANLLTNATTAASFASFIITGNEMLVQFGVVSSINILLTYLMTVVLIPTFLSYQKAPAGRQFDYMSNNRLGVFLNMVSHIVEKRRSVIYTVATVLIIVAVFGALKLETTGCVVDDISKKDKLYKDLVFFENHFNGVMPYEITIDTKKPKGILKTSFINKIQQLEDTLAMYHEFSKPLSVAEVVKFARASFYNGNKDYYKIPSNREFAFIMNYMPEIGNGVSGGLLDSFIDGEMQKTRVSVQMANVTTPKIDSINESLKPKIAKIFPPENYDVTITGSSIVFLEGTNYLIRNLLYSLILAFVVIAILLTLTFRSFRIVCISLIPNIIPLLLTAAMMGLCGIPLKTSSILIFSIALGIGVDNTIHYLSRYRLHLKSNDGDVKRSVFDAIMETGPSMIYSAIVLICGFLIFAFSSFGATQVVGYLVPFTLLIALITNLIILPSLILTFGNNNDVKDVK